MWNRIYTSALGCQTLRSHLTDFFNYPVKNKILRNNLPFLRELWNIIRFHLRFGRLFWQADSAVDDIFFFYLLFACLGQEQHCLNSNRMIGRSVSLFLFTHESKPSCLAILLSAASALPPTLNDLGETSAEKAPDEKCWWIKNWMKDATWWLWNWKNIDSCSCRSSAYWRLPRAAGALRGKLSFPWP